jgi:urea-proton symporter
MGVIISAAVLPATLALMWKDQNWIAASASPVLGLAVALIAWLVTAKQECGVLNVDCTGSNNPMLAGNVAALLSPLVFVPVLTFAFGRQNYDWQSMMNIKRGDDTEIVRRASVDLEQVPGQVPGQTAAEAEQEQKKLKKSAIIARSLTGFMTIALLVLWPMPLYGSGYIFSKKFFTGKFQCVAPFILRAFPLTLHRLGRRRYPMVVLQHLLCGSVPSVARPQDHGSYRQIHVP